MELRKGCCLLILLLGLGLSFSAAGFDCDLNPARLSQRQQPQLAIGFQRLPDAGLRLVYTEPDYGFGAGALGFEYQADIASTMAVDYSIAQALANDLFGRVTLRYQTWNESGREHTLAVDLGLSAVVVDGLEVGLQLQDAAVYAFGGEGLSSKPVLCPEVVLRLGERWTLGAALMDLAQGDGRAQWQISAEGQVWDETALLLGYRQVENQQYWEFGVRCSPESWTLEYVLTFDAAERDLAHAVTVGLARPHVE